MKEMDLLVAALHEEGDLSRARTVYRTSFSSDTIIEFVNFHVAVVHDDLRGDGPCESWQEAVEQLSKLKGRSIIIAGGHQAERLPTSWKAQLNGVDNQLCNQLLIMNLFSGRQNSRVLGMAIITSAAVSGVRLNMYTNNKYNTHHVVARLLTTWKYDYIFSDLCGENHENVFHWEAGGLPPGGLVAYLHYGCFLRKYLPGAIGSWTPTLQLVEEAFNSGGMDAVRAVGHEQQNLDQQFWSKYRRAALFRMLLECPGVAAAGATWPQVFPGPHPDLPCLIPPPQGVTERLSQRNAAADEDNIHPGTSGAAALIAADLQAIVQPQPDAEQDFCKLQCQQRSNAIGANTDHAQTSQLRSMPQVQLISQADFVHSPLHTGLERTHLMSSSQRTSSSSQSSGRAKRLKRHKVTASPTRSFSFHHGPVEEASNARCNPVASGGGAGRGDSMLLKVAKCRTGLTLDIPKMSFEESQEAWLKFWQQYRSRQQVLQKQQQQGPHEEKQNALNHNHSNSKPSLVLKEEGDEVPEDTGKGHAAHAYEEVGDPGAHAVPVVQPLPVDILNVAQGSSDRRSRALSLSGYIQTSPSLPETENQMASGAAKDAAGSVHLEGSKYQLLQLQRECATVVGGLDFIEDFKNRFSSTERAILIQALQKAHQVNTL